MRRVLLLCVALSAANASQFATQQAEVIAAGRSVTPAPILFPFVTNQIGFDTQITLSNTSADTVGTAPQNGTCTISYFGSAAPSPQVTPAIAAGKQLVFNLSAGGGGIAGAPGFQGYIIANCTFPLARGTAKIFGGIIATSYDGQILSLPRSTANPVTLLFPFLTNQGGMDSGITLENTSLDPFGSPNTGGTCTLNFFGINAPVPALTGFLSAGSTSTSLVSAIAPGFQGYMVARCNFSDAAGFSFIADTGARNIIVAEIPEQIASPRDPILHPLLFSFLTNQGGLDSNITIANTTKDIFGTPNVAGTCTLSFFGANAPPALVTPSIAAGSSYNAMLSTVAPNFSGYVTAVCQFPDARGFSYIIPSGSRSDGDAEAPETVALPRSGAPTSLLFSTVSNWTGSDTLIAISNTSLDPFATPSIGGTCRISYFGDMIGGGPAPAAQTSTIIPPGGALTFTLSAGNPAQGIAGAPGFRGYVIADCSVPLARGRSATITLPDLTATKTNNVGGGITVGGGWKWKIVVNNAGDAPAVFPVGATILSDNLPASNLTYGAPTVSGVTNFSFGSVSCGIASNNLTCTATGGTSPVFFGAHGSFQVEFTVTPATGGTFANPRSGGTCAADPANVVAEANEGNNACSDTVTVFDGTVGPSGGTVTDPIYGASAEMVFPPGILPATVKISITVFPTPLDTPNPVGFSGPGTLFVDFTFSPAINTDPFFVVPPPGVTLVLPLVHSMTPGTTINLYRFDPSAGHLVAVLDTFGNLCIGTVDAGGMSATFGHVGHLSTYVGLTPSDTTPPVIVPHIAGTAGSDGWYRSDVTVTWDVSDPESNIFSSTGCGLTKLSAETAGTKLTCSATNFAGLSNSVPVTIKIDKMPPVISGMPGASCSLWPPNHKLVQVAVVTAADALSGVAAGSFRVTGSSSEASSPGEQDVVITPNGSGGFVVQLRADRSGNGPGRIYTLNATAMDLAGNIGTATATCEVPHDRGK